MIGICKISTEVIVRLEESKDIDEVQTVKLLRESLKRYSTYVQICENAPR